MAGDVCQSYRPDSLICRDGFPQRALCTGNGGCSACGKTREDLLPLCMSKDKAPAHLFDDAGMPRLAEHRRADHD